MKQLKINNETLNIPSQWNEFTLKQFSYIASLINGEIPVTDFKLKLLLKFSGLKVLKKPELYQTETPDFVMALKNKKFLISVQDLSFAANIFNFLFKTEKTKEGKETSLLYSKLHICLLKSFTHKRKTYYGPADALTNILFAEYIHCETFFVNYCKTKDQVWLQKIMAVLFRPQKKNYKPNSVTYNGDRRETFNDFLIDQRAKKFNTVPKYIKNMIYLFYSGCYNYIHTSYPAIFQGNSSGKKQEIFEGFLGLVSALANNDVTKNEQIRQSYLWEVLVTLNQLALQREEMEKKFNKTK